MDVRSGASVDEQPRRQRASGNGVYGIGLIAQALHIEDQVVILKVTTDTLRDHADSADQQRALLERGRRVLGHVVAALFDRFGAPT